MKFKILLIFIPLIANYTFADDTIRRNDVSVFETYDNDPQRGAEIGNTITSVSKINDNDQINKLFKEDSTILSFDKTYYIATYTVAKDGTYSITPDDAITISDSKADVTVNGDEAFHFTIDCSTSVCTLSIERELPESVLANKYEIILELQATKNEVVEPAFALLIINLPLKNVKPTPQFTQAYYIYEYQIDDDGPSLISDGDSVAVVDDSNTSVEVTLSDYQDYFSVDAKLEKINVSQPLTDNILKENAELLITLTAILEGAAGNGTATLLIRFSNDNSATVSFDKSYYKGTYTVVEDVNDYITIEDIIISSDSEANVTLTGDDAFHFSISCTFGKCGLILIEDLPNSILTNKTEIVIGLEASTQDNAKPASAFVIISLPLANINLVPKFTQTYFIYEYQIDDKGTALLQTENPIDVTSDDKASINITLSRYQDNFAVTYDPKTDQWNIGVKENLNDSILNENSQLIISLTSTLNDSDQSTATLLIELPGKDASNVTFDKPFYEATYTSIKDDLDLIALEDNITISDEEAEVSLSGDYAYHFVINCLDGNCQLTVKEDLPEDILTSSKEIIIGLKVSTEENVEPSIALIIVHLPLGNVKSAPKFDQVYYIYEYKVDGEKPSLTPNGEPISITSDNNSFVQVTLNDYEDNFNVTYDSETDKWNINITEALNESILKENSNLVVILTGELDDSEYGTATLLINLPEKNLTEATFDKSFYRATYIVTDGELDEIITEENITISDSEATIILTGDYAHHFSIDCSTGKCQLTVEDDLSEKILSREKDIILGLEVTKKDIVEPITTYLLITLPSGDIKLGPEFSQTYYIYEYQVDGEELSLVPVGNPITLTSDNNTFVQITLSYYENNFNVIYNSETDKWNINITEPISETVLKENTELVLGLTGELGNSEKSTATLLIKLPEKNLTAVTFGKSFYKATYLVKDEEFDEVITEEDITISDSKATVALAGDYAAHFNINCSTGKCQLTVEDDLSEKILSRKMDIILGLEVTKEDIVEPVTAYLLITLPSKNISSGVKFSQIYYVYKYQVDGEEPSLTPDGDPIIITSDNKALVQITLSDYEDNFNITYDAEADQWNISVQEPLDDTVLNKNTELVVSLTGVLSVSDMSTATLLIKLPEQNPLNVTFDKAFYRASYQKSTDDQLDIITTEENITISDSNATVILTGDYAYHFGIICSSGKCQLTVKDNIAENILDEDYEIILELKASKEDFPELDTAFVIISLPLENAKSGPKFTQTYYIYEYQINDQGTPSLVADENAIAIASDDNVNVTLDSYQDNFVLAYDNETNQWNISVETSLDDSILNEYDELVIRVTGIFEDSDEIGTATLIIKLPSTNAAAALSFEKSFYRASYTVIEDGTDSITSEGIAVNDTEAVVTITGIDAYNFGLNFTNGKYQLSVKENLPESILSNDTVLVIGLEAIKEDMVEPITTFVIISLPLQNTKTSLKFTQTYYIYEYQIDDKGTASLAIIGNPMAVANDNDKSVNLVLSDYHNNLELKYDTNTKQVQITVQKPLDDRILKKQSELIITVTGIVEESEEEVTATLLIKLPKITVTFGKFYYKATYTATEGSIHSVAVDDDITITNKEAEVAISGDYPSNFAVDCGADGTCKLSLIEDLPEKVLAKESEIVIELDAVVTNVAEHGRALVLIKLPLQNAQSTPEFTTYTIDDNETDSITNDKDITINDSKAAITITGGK